MVALLYPIPSQLEEAMNDRPPPVIVLGAPTPGHEVSTVVMILAVTDDGSEGLMSTQTALGATPMVATSPGAIAAIMAAGRNLAPHTKVAKVVARTFHADGTLATDEVLWRRDG